MYYIRIFSFIVNLSPNCQGGRVHSDEVSEPVWTHIIQRFVYRGVNYFAEPSKGTVRFLVRFGSGTVFLI